MKKTRWLMSITTAFLLTASLANADNTIVITAARTQIKALKSPSLVNVISQKQLKQQGIDFAQNAFKFIPGISLVSNGAFGGQTSIYIRGLKPYYTKFLIDGIDVSDPSMTQPYLDFSSITSNAINRIEVVQGAQSGLYGANAIAGVINMITKKGQGKPYIKYTQGAGSFDTYSENLESGGNIKNISFYIDVFRLDTKGISKMDKYNPSTKSYSRGDEKDAFYKTAFNSRIEFKPIDSIKIGNVFIISKNTNYLDNGWYVTPSYSYLPDDAVPSNNTPEAKSLRCKSIFVFEKLYISKTFRAVRFDLNTFYVSHRRNYLSAPSSWYDFKGRRWGYKAKITYKIGIAKIITGGGYTKESYQDSTNFKKLRYNIGGFGEIITNFNNLTTQISLREDHFSTFGNHFTYKTGLSYLIPATATILKANYSTGFRAPSVFELYAPPNPSWWFLGGNENLNPEKSRGWDFGFTQFFLSRKVSLGLTFFKNIIKNRIAYYTDPATWKSTYMNIKGKTVTHGFEVQTKISPIKWLDLALNYTYTRSIDPDTGKQSARVPLRIYSGWIKVSTFDKKLSAVLDGRYIGKRYNDRNHKYQTGKYAVFDLTTIYKPLNNLQLSLSIKNIFNRFYQEVYGYSTLPRSVFAKISYKF